MSAASLTATRSLTNGGRRSATRKAAKKSKAAERESIIVQVSPETRELVDDLVVATGSSTRAEFFRNMIRAAEAMRSEMKEGNRPLWQDKDGNLYRSQIHGFLFQKPIK